MFNVLLTEQVVSPAAVRAVAGGCLLLFFFVRAIAFPLREGHLLQELDNSFVREALVLHA